MRFNHTVCARTPVLAFRGGTSGCGSRCHPTKNREMLRLHRIREPAEISSASAIFLMAKSHGLSALELVQSTESRAWAAGHRHTEFIIDICNSTAEHSACERGGCVPAVDRVGSPCCSSAACSVGAPRVTIHLFPRGTGTHAVARRGLARASVTKVARDGTASWSIYSDELAVTVS